MRLRTEWDGWLGRSGVVGSTYAAKDCGKLGGVIVSGILL